MIILGLDVLSGASEIIGNPQNIDQIGSQQTSAPAQNNNNNQVKPLPRVTPGQPSYPNQQRQQQQQKPAQQRAQVTTSGNTQTKNIFPILSLNPYQNKWTIKARVTRKSPMRTWEPKSQNDKGGQLFSVDLVDSQGGEIRATAFRDVAEELYKVLEENKVYIISHGQIKFANPKFNKLKHDYEITFEASTEVEECPEDNAIPTVQYNFERIATLVNQEKDQIVDVIGVIAQVADVANITTKAGKELAKRDVYIADDTSASIRITFWAETAINFDIPVGGILAIKGARLSDFGNKSLSTIGSTTFEQNPDLPEAHRLRGWYDETGGAITQVLTQEFTPGESAAPAPKKSFAEFRELNITSTPTKFSNRATVTSTPDFTKKDVNMWYPACPGRDPNDSNRYCNKKVSFNNGQWVCEKCDGTFPQPKYRYVLSCCVADETGHTWVTLFDETAQQLLKMPADNLRQIKDEDDDKALKILRDARFQTFNMKFVAREQNDQDGEARVRCTIQSMTPVNYVEESRNLIAQIQQLNLTN